LVISARSSSETISKEFCWAMFQRRTFETSNVVTVERG